jgi:hypothetical protein
MTFAVGKKAPAKAKTVAVKKAVTKAVAKPAAKAAPKVAAKAAPAPKKVVAKAAPKVVAKAAPKAVAKAVTKKVVAKPAPKKVVVAPKKVVKPAPKPAPKKAVASVGTVASIAIPGETAPALLDGSLPGDVGFDPCFLSTKADTMTNYFNGIFDGKAPTDGLTWYREAELMHGRICMVAVLGFIVPGFGTFEGNEWTNSFGYTNPLEAAVKAPSASLFQIFAFMSALEFRRINIILKDGGSYQAGDSQKWGQGPGRWNPLGLNYSPAEYAEKQLQEIKHARLAMIGFLGLVFQANASGVSVVDQLSAAFVSPTYYGKAGYFFPDGI